METDGLPRGRRTADFRESRDQIAGSPRRPCGKFSHRIHVCGDRNCLNFTPCRILTGLGESPLRHSPRSSPSCSPSRSVRCSPRSSDRYGLSNSTRCSHGYYLGCGTSCSPRCSLRSPTGCSTGRSDRCSRRCRPCCSPRSSDRCCPDSGQSSFLSCSASSSVRESAGGPGNAAASHSVNLQSGSYNLEWP